MMTIRTTCPHCGEVDLPACDVAMTFDQAQYVFQCPACGLGIAKKTDRKIISALIRAGVVTLGTPPAQDPTEMQQQPEPPALTLDDLIDFGLNIDAELSALLGEDA